MSANKNIHQRLQEVQRQIGSMLKTERNSFQGYSYVGEYQILSKLRPLLNENGLTLTFDDIPGTFNFQETDTKKGGKEWLVIYEKRAILTKADTPSEAITFNFTACAQNTDIAKAKGAAETYGVKYFLMKLFLIPVSDNLDPDKFGEKDFLSPNQISSARESGEKRSPTQNANSQQARIRKYLNQEPGAMSDEEFHKEHLQMNPTAKVKGCGYCQKLERQKK